MSRARKKDLIRIDVPEEHAKIALDRVRPLCHESLRLVVAPLMLEQLMLSCYQQGLMDADQLARMGMLPAGAGPEKREVEG